MASRLLEVKRIILAALVGLLVNWPVLAADDGVGVLLHCAGWIQNVSGKRHGIATNVQIAREGSWVMWAGEKKSRTTREQPSWVQQWTYEFRVFKKDERIFFDPRDMALTHSGDEFYEQYACFPIENPF